MGKKLDYQNYLKNTFPKHENKEVIGFQATDREDTVKLGVKT